MKEIFEPEMIRIILGESISEDEFFPEEKAMILQMPKTAEGAQTLLDYLKSNMHCSYGWKTYFEQFDIVASQTQRNYARNMLIQTFDECYLRFRYPEVFMN